MSCTVVALTLVFGVHRSYLLSQIPHEILRTSAGFSAKVGAYVIPRQHVTPPPSLIEKIFPWVDTAIQQIERKAWPSSVAATNFLKLMTEFKTTLLQVQYSGFDEKRNLTLSFLYLPN